MSKHSEHYYSGNPEHANKKRVYITNSREMLRLLMNHKIHVFKVDQRTEWLGAVTEFGHGRLKTLCDAKKVYADGYGLYTLT
jgi:hypothetical protein